MRVLGLSWIVIAAILLSGCGGDGASPASAGESSRSPSPNSPASLLLQEGDLPPGSVSVEALPEPCSPLVILEKEHAEAAGSPLYKLGSKAVGEAVGIAPSQKRAAAAVEDLGSQERLDCIGSTIQSFGPLEGVSLRSEKPEPIAEGEEGSMIRFLELDEQEKPVNSTALVSFRSGRCIATLLFLLKGGDPGRAFIDDLTGRAYGLLADADATCR